MTQDDIEIINLSGDVKILTEQLAAANARAEAAEAKLAAVSDYTDYCVKCYLDSEFSVSFDTWWARCANSVRC